MTTIEQTGAAWLVIAGVCDCNHVALTVMDTSTCDPNAQAEADGEHEVVLYGADWRDLVAPAAREMRARTGHRIALTCAAVYVPRTEFSSRAPEEQHIYDELGHLIETLRGELMPLPTDDPEVSES